jgi:hypothetical protein
MKGEMMRIRMWAVVLLLVAFLPNAVPSQAGSAKAPAVKAPSSSSVASPVEDAGIVPCHLNPMASPTYPGFGPSFLVPNGGRCTGDLSCASKCCTNNICVPTP